MSLHIYKLVWWDTSTDDKIDALRIIEIFGSAKSTWHMWYTLTHHMKAEHVEIYNMQGQIMLPKKGPQDFYNLSHEYHFF